MEEINQRFPKSEEDAARNTRLDIEAQILKLSPAREEGSQTVTVGNFKITTTGKLTRKMDWKKWETLKAQIPVELHPVKFVQELDERGVKWLAVHEPNTYALLPIEIKPAKTGVSIKTTE